MLTSVGRAAARRVQTSRLSASTPSAAQLICRQSAVTSTLPIRSFTVSSWSPSPTAGDKKATAKKTATTTTKKATGTTKPKSKATDIKTKTTTKTKAAPKAKKAAEKPKKTKKVVDPERLKEKRKRLEIKELRKWALKDKLAQLPATSWLLYTTENRGSSVGNGGITQQIPELAKRFRELSQSEVDDLTRRASANRQKNVDNYKAWVETHEPARIHLANKCRRRLSFLTGKVPVKLITDERLPKRPSGAYAMYLAENYDNFGRSEKNQPKFQEIGQSWKSLNPTEKARYEERSADQCVKYKAEIEKLEARAKVIQETEVA